MFGDKRKREKIQPDVQIVSDGKKPAYDIFAALAKALLIFMLVYGALGGFLSAYEMQYNKALCIIVILVLAFLLSAIYEMERRWLSNLTTILVFLFYVYVALSNYWTLNSGYYGILNKVNEVSRRYLGITNGTEYALRVEEEYVAVTCFALFIGMVGVILLNIQLQGKVSLFKTIFWTFTPYIVPLYFERMPELIYILFLLTGYLTVAMLQSGNVRERLTGQMRYLLPLAAVIVVLVVRLFSFLWNQERYARAVPQSAAKIKTEGEMSNFAQYGLMALFRRDSAGGGISGGSLSRSTAVMPDYETDLIVRFTPYTYQPMYLKAFTGKSYNGVRWSKAEDDGLDDGLMEATVAAHMQEFEQAPATHGQGVMEVENVDAAVQYQYRPYYADEASIQKNGNAVVYTYYPALGSVGGAHNEIDSAYLEVPENCYKAVRQICEEAGFAGTEEEIAGQVVSFFAENYSYTLRPGFSFGSSDYISNFLLSGKKGYCAHFASAGTMLLRYMGIPARYVEGYAFSYIDIIMDGVLMEDARYEDYYTGYSPIGDTALVELEIPDAQAHAWVEIYVDGKGWLVVDPTPASTEEDTTSFWDAFMNGGSDRRRLDIGESNLGTYLETALDGMTNVLAVGSILLILFLGGGMLLRYYRERKLTGGERVRLEYRRLDRYLAARNREYARLRTIQEQLNWVEEQYAQEILPEQRAKLYQVFFAGAAEEPYDELRELLVKLRYRVRLPGFLRRKR